MTATKEPATEATPPRWRRKVLIWTAAGLVALVVAIAAWWGLAKAGAVPNATITTAPQPAQSAASVQPTAPLGVAAADACLGGPDPRHAVVVAQQIASLDTVGAAEFALAFVRFTGTHPYAADADQVLDQVMVDASTLAGAPVASINAQDQAEGRRLRVIPPLRYRVVNNDGGQAVVDVYYVAEQDSGDPAAAGTGQPLVFEVHLAAVGGHWSIVAHPGSPSAPYTGDPTFTAGFTDYAGVGCGE